MEKINIICVDDEREVLDAVSRDLHCFSSLINIEECESAQECLNLLEEFDADQEYVALIISDHVMPGQSGVEMLTTIEQDERFTGTKKILLTGLATQQDTIQAINNIRLDNFFEKIWDEQQFVQTVRELVTTYIVEKGIDYEPYINILDANTLYRLLK